MEYKKYVVKGKIKAKNSLGNTDFELSVSAKSKSHARAIAQSKIGANQHIKNNKINIISVEEGKEE